MKVKEIVDNMSTEIICVIDKSGSMNSIKSDAIGGFNSFLKEQLDVKDDTRITLSLFDTLFKPVYKNIPLEDAEMLTESTYVPSDMTALYDAIGLSIDEAMGRYTKSPESRPDRVLMVILTDGEENRSKEYGQERIFEMIKTQTEKEEWEFIFLAANQDAMKTGVSMGVKFGNTMTFASSSEGTQEVYAKMSASVKGYRSSKSKKADNLMNGQN